MLAYARQRGLQRALVTLPFLPLPLMAHLVGLLTPVPPAIARPLIEGLKAPSIVQDDKAARLFPHIRLRDYPSTLRESLRALTPDGVELLYDPARPVQTFKQDGFLLDVRQVEIEAAPEAVFRILTSLGGRTGWLFANFLWRLRGGLDRLVGGAGLRGRPEVLAPGGVVDFYRVQAIEPPRRLLLYAELRAPGQGWMEWRLQPQGASTRLTQIAWFAPRGLPGFLYWYILAPFHRFVFAGLLREIARKSR